MMYFLMAIVLSLTLFIYINKIKFTYDLDKIPWNRHIDLLKTPQQVISLILETKHAPVNCNVVSLYCMNDSDCAGRCNNPEFKCLGQKCEIKKEIEGDPINCNSKNGGVQIGLNTCLCTKPLFYVGERCEKLNPVLVKQRATISPNFEGTLDDEDIKFVQCIDETQSPHRFGHVIVCVNKKIADRIKNHY